MPHACPPWICFTFDNIFRRAIHDPRKILSPYVREGQTVLDLGAGKGYFTIPLAKLVGESGRVIAAEIHPAMLRGVERRARRAGVMPRVVSHLSTPRALGWPDPVDFILMFWMLHEVPDGDRLLAEVRAILKPGGRLLIVEPRFHVRNAAFEAILAMSAAASFTVSGRPRIALSRAVVLRPA